MAPIKNEILGDLGDILSALPSVFDHPHRDPADMGCAEGDGWIDSYWLVFACNLPQAHDVASGVIRELC